MKDRQDLLEASDQAERHQALDALRGFALLGILIMNIQSFSMIDAAYLNPTAHGDLNGPNFWVWLLSHIFADTKCMSLFSIMFGASVLLFTDRIEAKGRRPAGLYYRRIFWLLVFGMMHAYLFWHGDILVTYALCALILYIFRKVPPWVLLVLGLLTLSVASLLYVLFQWSITYWGEADFTEIAAIWSPSQEEVEILEATFRGSWQEQMSKRAVLSAKVQTFLFLILLGWRAGGLMLVGMALFRKGVLTAERSDRFYIGCILTGMLVGVPVVAYGAYRNIAAGWDVKYSMFAGTQFNYWGGLLITLGYIGLVMLAHRRGWFSRLQKLLADVGRTAFSNYILQTLICTLLFYGHGFGLFGKVPRTGQLLIVVGIWIIQILLTNLWLKRFRLGPLEWLWKSLTYLKRQPMRLTSNNWK